MGLKDLVNNKKKKKEKTQEPKEFITEQEIVDLMVDYIINDKQIESSQIKVDDLVEYASDYVEIENKEVLQEIQSIAFGVLDALKEEGYLIARSTHFEIDHAIDYDVKLEVDETQDERV